MTSIKRFYWSIDVIYIFFLIRCLLTCTNHLLYLDTGNVDLFGELSYGFVGIFIGEGINVDFYSWWNFHREKRKEMYEELKVKTISLQTAVSRHNRQKQVLTVAAGVMLEFVRVLWLGSLRTPPDVDKQKSLRSNSLQIYKLRILYFYTLCNEKNVKIIEQPAIHGHKKF